MDQVPGQSGARAKAVYNSGVLSDAQWTQVAGRLSLSDRELEVVRGVFDDLKEAAIAARMNISNHTVHTHLERLYRKLGVNGRCSMVVAVMGDHLAHLGSDHGGEPARG